MCQQHLELLGLTPGQIQPAGYSPQGNSGPVQIERKAAWGQKIDRPSNPPTNPSRWAVQQLVTATANTYIPTWHHTT